MVLPWVWGPAKELWRAAGLLQGSAWHRPNAPVGSEMGAAGLSPAGLSFAHCRP